MKAFNFATNVEYSGQNALLVGNGKYPAFASFNQLKSLGYSVNKGAKSVSVFCGYRKGKDGEKTVPCWGRVFDIIDTSAKDDADLIEFIEKGQREPSKLEVNASIGAMIFNAEPKPETKPQPKTKEISASAMMQSMGIEVFHIA